MPGRFVPPDQLVTEHVAVKGHPAVKVRHRNRYCVHVLKQGFHELRLSHRRWPMGD